MVSLVLLMNETVPTETARDSEDAGAGDGEDGSSGSSPAPEPKVEVQVAVGGAPVGVPVFLTQNLRRLAAELARDGERPVSRIDVHIIDDIAMADLHRKHFGEETTTDVISFDLADNPSGPAEALSSALQRSS